LRIPTSLANQRAFINIKFNENVPGGPCGRNDRVRLLLIDSILVKGKPMQKAAVVFSAAAVVAMTAVSIPTPVEARGGWGWGPGIAGGLIAGALIGGLASNAYGYGPGYGYYGPGYGYYGGYAPAYYGYGAPAYYRGGPYYYGGYGYRSGVPRFRGHPLASW
jgi:hypothetical protein